MSRSLHHIVEMENEKTSKRTNHIEKALNVEAEYTVLRNQQTIPGAAFE